MPVLDDGTGIDSQVIDQVFEPFFTTKETGHGLRLARQIVNNAGGQIRLVNTTHGTRFTIELPVAEDEVDDESGRASKRA